MAQARCAKADSTLSLPLWQKNVGLGLSGPASSQARLHESHAPQRSRACRTGQRK